MKKNNILKLFLLLALISLTLTATIAYFSDTETSEDNTFVAGKVDLKIDSQCTYNGVSSQECGTWDSKDLVSERFFSFSDIKPGDWGENTISLYPDNNDVWACLQTSNYQNLENTHTATEKKAGDTTSDIGELGDNIFFTAWRDNGNNIWEEGETTIFINKPASNVLNGKTFAIADSTTGGIPLMGGTYSYIGLQWCAGLMTADENSHNISCDGKSMDNKSQTDSLSSDLNFYVVQSRNNTDFKCASFVTLIDCADLLICGESCLYEGLEYGTVWGEDGKCWLDRNLGAIRLATSHNDNAAYGWIYQWGRGTDGHQIPTSGTTTILSNSDTPGHSYFVTDSYTPPYDWRSPQNHDLWQGASGINNPCPAKFRLPTFQEWDDMVNLAGIDDYNTAFSSSLKLTTAGYRDHSTGVYELLGTGEGYYWSSNEGQQLYFNYLGAQEIFQYNASGFSVRCISDTIN